MQERDNAFAIRIGLLTAIGYGLTVTAITYIDARIPSHVRFGARTYPCGYKISLLALPIFAVTFLMLRRSVSRGWKCFASCFAFISVVIGSFWAFKPEFPHGDLLAWSTLYAIAALTATWLRHSGPNLSFACDYEIPLQVRVEGLKSILSVWQAIALATCAGYLAVLVPWAIAILTMNSHIVTTERDLFLLNGSAIAQMVAASVAFLLGPVREVVVRVLTIAAEFASIREAKATDYTGWVDGDEVKPGRSPNPAAPADQKASLPGR